MWNNFFVAGGFAMYPTLLFGFALIAVTALRVFRGERRHERAARLLAATTLSSGLLGTCVGLSKSVHYMATLPTDQQLLNLALGAEESMHCLVLALLFLVLAGLVGTVVTLRQRGEDR